MILGTQVTICIKTLLGLLAMNIILIGESEVSVGLEYREDVNVGDLMSEEKNFISYLFYVSNKGKNKGI